jgi:hypothetical protein
LHLGCICLARYRGEQLLDELPRDDASGGALAFPAPAAVAFASEFDQAAEAEQGRELFGLVGGRGACGRGRRERRPGGRDPSWPSGSGWRGGTRPLRRTEGASWPPTACAEVSETFAAARGPPYGLNWSAISGSRRSLSRSRSSELVDAPASDRPERRAQLALPTHMVANR